MANNHTYKKFESKMTSALITLCVIFVLYLIAAVAGILWFKWVLAIVDMLFCICGLVVLYLSKELTHPRSLWMSCGFFAIFVCLLVSLILNYPG